MTAEIRNGVIVATERIRAPREVVFPYFTDPALIILWIGDRAELDPRPGGVFSFDMGEVAARGAYITVEPPHRVVFIWGIPGSGELPAGASTVEVVLTADGDDTIVELRTAACHPPISAATAPAGNNGSVSCALRPGDSAATWGTRATALVALRLREIACTRLNGRRLTAEEDILCRWRPSKLLTGAIMVTNGVVVVALSLQATLGDRQAKSTTSLTSCRSSYTGGPSGA